MVSTSWCTASNLVQYRSHVAALTKAPKGLYRRVREERQIPIIDVGLIAVVKAGQAGLVGHLGVLDDGGQPVVHGARSPEGAPGLYFTGYTNPISGMFRELGIDARRIARAVAARPSGTGPSVKRSPVKGQGRAGGTATRVRPSRRRAP